MAANKSSRKSMKGTKLISGKLYRKSVSSLKGQTEIVIVLAILIIVVAVAAITFGGIVKKAPLPENLASLGQSLETEIQTAVLDSSRSTLRAVASNGGYLSTTGLPVAADYHGHKIAYWQFGNLTLAMNREQVAKEIAKGVKDSLKNLDPQALSDKIGKPVSLGNVNDARVDVQIKDAEIVITVGLALSLDNFGVTDSIEISVPSTLGKSLDFASQVVAKNFESSRSDRGEEYENRFFERFTISSLYSYRVNGIDGQPKVPVTGSPLIGCAKSIYKSWYDVKPEMETLLRGTLKNTYIVGTTPRNITSISSFQPHTLPVYTNQKVSFDLAEDLSEKSFQMYPNPLSVRSIPAPYTTVCVSPPVVVNYWLLYPVVAEVGEGDDKFSFAFTVFVDGDEPGDYNTATALIDQWKYQAETCQQSNCEGTVYVEDAEGPLGLAHVNYAGCYLGRTDRSGVLTGSIPCGISVLEINKGDHTMFSEVASSTDLEYKIVHLAKTPTLKLNLYTVELSGQPGAYKIESVEPNTNQVAMIFKVGDSSINVQSGDSTTITSDVMSGLNTFAAAVRSATEEDLGGVFNDYIVNEENKELWVYLPVLKGGLGITKPQDVKLTPEEETEYDKLLNEGDTNKITAFIVKTAQSRGIDQSEIGKDTSIASAYLDKIISLSQALANCSTKIGESLPISDKPIDADKLKSC